MQTADGSPARADFFGVILDIFLRIQAAFIAGEPLCDLEIASCSLKALLGIISWKKSGLQLDLTSCTDTHRKINLPRNQEG